MGCRQDKLTAFFENLFSCIVICRQTGITHWAQLYKIFNTFFLPFTFFCLLGSTRYYHTKNYLQINELPFGSDNVTTYTKDLTIDMQDPGHTFFPQPKKKKCKRTSDDLRICDFTCLPNLIIAETKKQTQPTRNLNDAMLNWPNCNFFAQFGRILKKIVQGEKSLSCFSALLKI